MIIWVRALGVESPLLDCCGGREEITQALVTQWLQMPLEIFITQQLLFNCSNWSCVQNGDGLTHESHYMFID